MERFFTASGVGVLLLWVSGCAGVVSPQPGIIVNVTNSFTTIQVGSAAVTLQAAVENDPHGRGVTWALTLANVACSPTCGTLVPSGSQSLTAVYTPPATLPLNQSATITVASVTDHTHTYTFDFTIEPGISVVITDKFSSVYAGGLGVPLNSTVANDAANAGVTWTLTAGGASCSPACGTLIVPASPTFMATYTPPSALPTGANASPTITATSVTNTSAFDSFTFSINSASALFKGNYVFLLRGYDGSGVPQAMAGIVQADGAGNITAGELDDNDDGGITAIRSPVTGSYSIDLSFYGVARGTITLSSYTFPGTSVHPAFRFALSADATRGKIVEFDGTGYLNSGTMLLQATSAITSTVPAGSYAFGLDSDAPVGGRIVEAGQLVLGNSGVTGGVVDQSQAGALTPIYTAAPISAGPASAPDSLGRGLLTLTVNGDSTDFAYYIVSAQQLDLIEIDQGLKYGTVQAGIARQQKPLTVDTANTTSVLQMTGMDVVSGTNNIGPDVIIGVMNISGGTTFNLTFDENDLGNILTNHTTGNGSLASFDPTTGRGVLSAAGGFNSGFVNVAVFYVWDAGSGFIIDADPSTTIAPPASAVTNDAFSGTLTPQSAGPFRASILAGNSIVSSGASAIPLISNLAAAANFDSTGGTYSVMGDLTTNSQGGNIPDNNFTGSYGIIDSTLGRGTATVPAFEFGYYPSSQNYPVALYVVGANQFVMIAIQSGAYSGVSFFDPQ